MSGQPPFDPGHPAEPPAGPLGSPPIPPAGQPGYQGPPPGYQGPQPGYHGTPPWAAAPPPNYSGPPGHPSTNRQSGHGFPMWAGVLIGFPAAGLVAAMGATLSEDLRWALTGLLVPLLGLVLLLFPRTRRGGIGLIVGTILLVAVLALLAGACYGLVVVMFSGMG